FQVTLKSLQVTLSGNFEGLMPASPLMLSD
ncbi:uncharacterized protein METZ01_LOCUS163445, partial [marine metagenome]